MAKQSNSKRIGRPSLYSQKLGLEICFRLARGEALSNICQDKEMPSRETVYVWILDGQHKDFSDNYARSRAIQAEMMFEEIIKISDESDSVIKSGAEKKSSAYAQNQRLKVDSRKWYLSKVLPKKFGDKLDLTTDGKSLPQPLLHVLHNDIHNKDTGTEKKD